MNITSSAALAPPVIAECKDTTEKIELYEPHSIYIKPIARLNITIQLPPNKNPGQTISFTEIVDKLKQLIQPQEFIYLRVIKSSLEFIRLEGEVENKTSFKNLLTKLDGVGIKLNSYIDVLKIRAAEAKIVYPNRHDWDSFFKDPNTPTDELRPGDRPDTVHLTDLPCKWFADKNFYPPNTDIMSIRPNELVLKQVFSIFGEIRLIDIPLLNNSFSQLRKQPAIDLIAQTCNVNMPTFEAFIQYKDYIGFVKAMDTFRGMKLLYIDEFKNAFTANVRVDFDRTKHLSDREIKKREIDKLKAIEIEKIKNATMEKEKDKETKQKEIANYRAMLNESIEDERSGLDEKSKEQRRREREEIRKQKRLAKKQQEEEKKLEHKIALEERKILIAQRKLESMRLLEELFNRVKVIVSQEDAEKRLKDHAKEKLKREAEEADQEKAKRARQQQEEFELKEKIAKNLAKNEQAANKEADENEVEGFELRKDTIEEPSQEASNPPDHSQHTQIVMPRAVLLSNQQFNQQHVQLNQPKLYDEEDNIEVDPKTEESLNTDLISPDESLTENQTKEGSSSSSGSESSSNDVSVPSNESDGEIREECDEGMQQGEHKPNESENDLVSNDDEKSIDE